MGGVWFLDNDHIKIDYFVSAPVETTAAISAEIEQLDSYYSDYDFFEETTSGKTAVFKVPGSLEGYNQYKEFQSRLHTLNLFSRYSTREYTIPMLEASENLYVNVRNETLYPIGLYFAALGVATFSLKVIKSIWEVVGTLGSGMIMFAPSIYYMTPEKNCENNFELQCGGMI